MALDDPYGDLATLKVRAGITGTANDAVLTQVLREASRQIEHWTHRVFNQTPAGTVRYFTGFAGTTLFIDDLVSVEALATDDGSRLYATSWAATDYDLLPFGAAEQGQPFTRIDLAPTGRYPFWRVPKGVRVTGTWGWPSVPDDVAGATYLQATRLWKRKDAPFGVTGSAEIGQMRMISEMDPDVKAMIAPYVRRVMF